MGVRTHLYHVNIEYPEVIEDVSEKYSELLETVVQHGNHLSLNTIWGNGTILCPRCGFDYMHIIAVAVVTYSKCVLTTAEGTKIIHADGLGERLGWRGCRVVIFFQCENGHVEGVIFQFHKGQTFCLFEEVLNKKVFGQLTHGKWLKCISRW